MAKNDKFERQVMEIVKAIRNLISEDDNAPTYFHFRVDATGRAREGEVKITFQLGESEYTSVVKGDNVESVLTEYLRRIGWQNSHDYLALPAVASTNVVDFAE